MEKPSNNEVSHFQFVFSVIGNLAAFLCLSGIIGWLAVTQVAPLPADNTSRSTGFVCLGIALVATVAALFYGVLRARNIYFFNLAYHAKR